MGFSQWTESCRFKGVCDLAEKYDALVMVDDSHATGSLVKQVVEHMKPMK